VDGRSPLVNVATTVWGGSSPYAHPDHLAATVEVRTVPGMSQAEVLAALRGVVADHELAQRVTLEVVPGSWVPPGRTVDDPRLLAAAEAAWTSVLGRVPEHAVLPAATDSCHLDRVGIPTLPAFGPGSFAEAHRPGESIAAADLRVGVAMIERLARGYLGFPQAG
jgi:acetylornithine deacetylase/succinyl-diaminopimelate desuccinylase-like protein